ncbi:MAG: hypothetical protein Q9202_005370 [Teloschistes flavicans]
MADQGSSSSFKPIKMIDGLGALHKLPPEVRLMIWQHFIPPDSPTDAELKQRRHQPCELSAQPPTAGHGLLSILRASRQIYEEVVEELYRKRSLTICFNTANFTAKYRDSSTEEPLLFEIMFGGTCSWRSLEHAVWSSFERIRLYIVFPKMSTEEWFALDQVSVRTDELLSLLEDLEGLGLVLPKSSLPKDLENAPAIDGRSFHPYSSSTTSPSPTQFPPVSIALNISQYGHEEYLLGQFGWQAVSSLDLRWLGFVLREKNLTIDALHD